MPNDSEKYNYGLKRNVKKTKMMVFVVRRSPDVLLNGTTVQIVEQFKYPSHILTRYLKHDRDLEREMIAISIRGNMFAKNIVKKFQRNF